MKKENE